MRVDVDTGAPRDEEARIARQYGQNGTTPIINPSHPVCCLTILVQRSMWYRPSGLEPNETPSRTRRSGTFGGQESSWDVVPTVYCAVLRMNGRLVIRGGPILPTPSIASEYSISR